MLWSHGLVQYSNYVDHMEIMVPLLPFSQDYGYDVISHWDQGIAVEVIEE